MVIYFIALQVCPEHCTAGLSGTLHCRSVRNIALQVCPEHCTAGLSGTLHCRSVRNIALQVCPEHCMYAKLAQQKHVPPFPLRLWISSAVAFLAGLRAAVLLRCPIVLQNSTCTVLHVLSYMHCPTCTVLHALSYMHCPTCTVLHALSYMYCPTCTHWLKTRCQANCCNDSVDTKNFFYNYCYYY